VTDEFTGYQRDTDGHGDLNATAFLVRQMAGRVGTMLPVKVLSCTNAGDLSPVGFVDVQPLVDQHDGAGNSVPHGPLHNLPYVRIQGGDSAVILDPKPGDKGLAFFAQRDISAVKATGGANVQGSRRRHDMADGCYLGGILNAAPTQYVRFGTDGVEVVTTGTITLKGRALDIRTQTVTHNGVGVGGQHRHRDVQAGQAISGIPVQDGAITTGGPGA